MGPINIRRHYPTDTQVWISEEPISEPFVANVQMQVNAGHSEKNKLDWRVQTVVTFNAKIGEKLIAKGSITYVGFFDFPADIPEGEMDQFAIRQGGTLLYGATRELVANISARAPNRLITLPPIFIQKAEKMLDGPLVNSATV